MFLRFGERQPHPKRCESGERWALSPSPTKSEHCLTAATVKLALVLQKGFTLLELY